MTAPKRQRRSGRWKNNRRAVVVQVGDEYLAMIHDAGKVTLSICGSRVYVLAQLFMRGADRSALWLLGDGRAYVERKMSTATGRLLRQSA